METITIEKSNLEKFGKNLFKKIDEFLHDEYIITFPEMKLEQEKFDKFLNKNIPGEMKLEQEKNDKFLNIFKIGEITLKEKYKNEQLDIKEIYDILDIIELDEEIDEDLYYEKKAFIYLYLVFDHYFTYLIKH